MIQVFESLVGTSIASISCERSTFVSYDIKHLLDETESKIQFIASGQGNIGRSEAEPNIILYGRNQLDVARGQVQ